MPPKNSNDFETLVNNAFVIFDATAVQGEKGSWTSGVTVSGNDGLVESVNDAPLTGTFASFYNVMGLWVGNDDFGYDFNVNLEVFNGATSLGSVSLAVNKNDFADQFIGLMSDEAFNKFQLTYRRPGLVGVRR